jgi:hypothetical protein
LIQGVHAQSVVFIGLESVEGLLDGGLWRGSQGHSSTTELSFRGSRPDRLVVRIGGIRSDKKMTSCSFQLESPEERFKPIVKGTLEFTQDPMRSFTKVNVHGTADRQLVGASAQTAAVQGVANEYVRQLLDEVARRLEELAKGLPATPGAGPPRLGRAGLTPGAAKVVIGARKGKSTVASTRPVHGVMARQK